MRSLALHSSTIFPTNSSTNLAAYYDAFHETGYI